MASDAKDQKLDLSGYNKQRKEWEERSKGHTEKAKQAALTYLEELDEHSVRGPVAYAILDLSCSEFIAVRGQFADILGLPFRPGIKLTEFVNFIYPPHNYYITEHFPDYIRNIMESDPDERNEQELTIEHKYRNGFRSIWLSYNAFRYFTDHPDSLGYCIMKYTDITDVKTDKSFRYIHYHKKKGYLINATYGPNYRDISNLTPTEVRVVKKVARGLSDKEIAERLGIATGTVKQHKKHIFSKLGISKSLELVAIAYDNGMMH